MSKDKDKAKDIEALLLLHDDKSEVILHLFGTLSDDEKVAVIAKLNDASHTSVPEQAIKRPVVICSECLLPKEANVCKCPKE